MTSKKPETPAWQQHFDLLTLIGYTAFAIMMLAPGVDSDGDTYWHLATGRWILAHHAVPATDPFSYAAVGRPWVTHEWLSEVVMTLFYYAFGWGGLRLFVGSAFLATALLLCNRLRHVLPWRAAMIVMGFSLWLLYRHALERPHMLALPILALWTIELMRAREKDRLPSLWLLPLMAVWANLHGSFVFGLVFTCFFALEAFLGAKGRRIRTAALWGGLIVALLVAALATPNGLAGLTYPIKVMSMGHLQAIQEWGAVDFSKPTVVPITFFFALGACLTLGVRMPLVRTALLLLLVQMTFVHVRQEIVLAIAAPLLLADPLGRALRERGAEVPTLVWPSLRELAAPIGVVAALLIGTIAYTFVTSTGPVDGDDLPVSALAHTPASLRAKPAFNTYGFGGWLIFNGVSPFIDGRSDMYGDDHLKRYRDLDRSSPIALDDTFNRYGIAWSILTPTSGLAPALKAKGWRTVYADKWAIVQARPDALNDPPASPRSSGPAPSIPPGRGRPMRR